ncbi:MAG: hypothetical protein WAT71_05705 [Ignavibacteria bacterium]
MNKIKFLALTVFVTVFMFSDSYSQNMTRKSAYLASLEYNTTFNMGQSADFLSTPGFWGGSMEIKSFVKNNLAVGILIGNNVVSEEQENGSTEVKNGTLTGPQARFINYAPVMATIGYFFNKGGRNKTVPYIQANVGSYYVQQRLQVGANIIDNDNWHFGIGPQVGVLFNVGQNVAIVLDARYNYAFSSGDPIGTSDNNAYSFINANIGLAYTQ